MLHNIVVSFGWLQAIVYFFVHMFRPASDLSESHLTDPCFVTATQKHKIRPECLALKARV